MKKFTTHFFIFALMTVGVGLYSTSALAQNTGNNPGNPNAPGYTTSQQQVSAPSSYTPIVGIPGINGNTLSTEEYVRALYYLAITVAALLAVYKIMVAGIRWMFDGVVTHKEEAKKDIWGAVLGLLIVLSAVVVLETINEDLTKLSVLGNAPPLKTIRGNGSDQPAPPAKIGDSLVTCEASEQELRHFQSTCPGKTNTVLDAASGCGTLHCDTTKDERPTLACSGNTCTCSFTEGSSECVSECKLRKNYVDHTITTDSVTCIYAPNEPSKACTRIVACCPAAGLSGCTPKDQPICKVDSTSVAGDICYYIEE